MDAQELRNLQEAYLEVVENQQFDEELTGERLSRAEIKMKSLGRRKSTLASREALSRVSIGKEGTGVQGGIKAPVKRGGGGTAGRAKVSGTGGDDMDRGYGNKAKRRAAALNKEQVDIYDIILSHLLDEGYAETPEAAEAIMVNMSEEWRDSIVEEVLDEAEGSYGQTPRATAAYGQLAIARQRKPASEYSKKGEKTTKVKAAEKHFYRTLDPDAGHSGRMSTKSIHPAGRQGMTQDDRDDANPEGPGSLPKGKKLIRQRITGKSA